MARSGLASTLSLVAAIAIGLVASACTGTDASAPPVEDRPEDRCTSCHMPDYRNAHPVHVNVKPKTCPVCHAQTSWHPTVLVHEWALTGKHLEADCFACHKDKPAVFRGMRSDCVSCHEKDLDRQNTKNTWHAHFPKTCGDCHQATGWKPAKSEPGFEEPTEPTPTPTATATPTPNATPTPKAKPKPVPKPVPKPTPSATPTTAPTTPEPTPVLPEPLSGASRRAPKGR